MLKRAFWGIQQKYISMIEKRIHREEKWEGENQTITTHGGPSTHTLSGVTAQGGPPRTRSRESPRTAALHAHALRSAGARAHRCAPGQVRSDRPLEQAVFLGGCNKIPHTGGFSQRDACPHSSRGCKSKALVMAGPGSPEALLLGSQTATFTRSFLVGSTSLGSLCPGPLFLQGHLSDRTRAHAHGLV